MCMETARLLIAPAEEVDIPVLHRLFNLPEIQKYNCMTNMTLEKVRKRFEEGSYNHCIRLRDTGTLIGTIGVEEDDLRYRANSVSLNYELDPAWHHRGYMTEALTAVLSWLFVEKMVDNVTVRVFGENAASIRLVERLGFYHEGTLRRAILAPSGILYDDCIYAMNRDEFARIYGTGSN